MSRRKRIREIDEIMLWVMALPPPPPRPRLRFDTGVDVFVRLVNEWVGDVLS